MIARTLSLKSVLVALSLVVPAAPAFAAYECRFFEVDGVAQPQHRRAAAERDAKRAWEAAARSKFGVNYRWVMAVKTMEPVGGNRNGRWTATAKAYPCRVTGLPDGTILVNPTEAERACADRPNLQTAKRYNCPVFYLLGR